MDNNEHGLCQQRHADTSDHGDQFDWHDLVIGPCTVEVLTTGRGSFCYIRRSHHPCGTSRPKHHGLPNFNNSEEFVVATIIDAAMHASPCWPHYARLSHAVDDTPWSTVRNIFVWPCRSTCSLGTFSKASSLFPLV